MQRVIKKYPNRRLYDTWILPPTSPLSEVRQLVIDNQNVVVRDKTGEDLTRSIPLQIILEEEAAGHRCSARRCLATSSVSAGAIAEGLHGAYLEKNVTGVHRCKEAGRAIPERDARNVGAVHEPAVAHAPGA